MPQHRALLDWVRVDRASATPLHSQISEQLSTAVLDGRLPPGTALPSSRALAAELAVARGTVAIAYDRLLGENLLEVRSRSLTFVPNELPARITGSSGAGEESEASEGSRAVDDENPPPYAAFLPGIPAFDIFPATRWARLLAKRSHQMPQELADNDFHMGGYKPLKAVLARHLKTARGISCDTEQVVITTSARAALATVCDLLATRGDRCLVEDPGYAIARRIMSDYGIETVPVPVDAKGMNVDAAIPRARLAYVTPTYQMPMGVRLADHRARALIEWARQESAWIVEDDYDSEFRYAGEAIAALQGVNPSGRVIHIGTFSKTLFPSLRVAYLVVPKELAKRFADAVYLHGHEPTLHVQAALSDFIIGGHYAVHIRRARSVYRRRQSLLVRALNRHLEGIVQVAQPSGGMHVIVPLPPDIPARSVQALAAKAALHVRPISYYAAQAEAPNALQLGYAAVPERLIEPAVDRLAGVIRSLATGPRNDRETGPAGLSKSR